MIFLIELCNNLNECICRIFVLENGNYVPSGTGFFINEDGIVITCNHVICNSSLEEGRLAFTYNNNIRVEKNGINYRVNIVHDINDEDPIFMDYAILEITGGGFQALPISHFDEIQVGNEILFGGYPFGRNYPYFTKGLISAKHPKPSRLNQLVQINTIALDANVNPGNSGGPLYDISSGGIAGIISSRIGNIEHHIKRLEDLHDENDEFQVELINSLYSINEIINPGIGQAHSIEYVYDLLISLEIL